MQNNNSKANVEVFDNGEYQLLGENILSYQLCLFFKEKDKNNNPIQKMGTAISVNIAKKTFLLTAGHNFGSDTSQHAGAFETQSPNRPDNLKKYVIDCCTDMELDIAVIEFDNKDKLVSPLPENMFYANRLPEWVNDDNCGFSISGYQSELAAELSKDTLPEKLLTLSTLFNCNYISPDNWPDYVSKKKNPDHHIIGKIKSADSGYFICGSETSPRDKYGNLIPPDNIKGVSGGGMWLSCKHPPPIIAPVNYLIGIENCWFENKRVVCGVKIIHFLDMIEKNYPKLTDNIQKIKCRVIKY